MNTEVVSQIIAESPLGKQEAPTQVQKVAAIARTWRRTIAGSPGVDR